MTAVKSVSSPFPTLTQRRIFTYWFPLAASWLLMGSEMPFVNGVLARLSEPERMIAAFGIVGSLSITIESPVISLLATSTALARTRQNYLMLRRFTVHLMVATTLLHLLMGWTPLFDLVVVDWMGVPTNIVQPIQLGMRIMVLWSAAIAWRRFTQGILIRYGRAGYVGRGTAIRLISSAGTALILGVFSDLPGIAVGALALSMGVIVEALYAHFGARDLIACQFGSDAPSSDQPALSYGELVRFHTPLAASVLLYLLTQPLISAALSRSPNPETTLAAWPVISGLLFITRSPAVALPEVVIALAEEKGSGDVLRSFSVRVGLGCMAVLALFSFTPLSVFYFQTLIGISPALGAIAVIGGQVGVLSPLLMAWVSLYRGTLTANKHTLPITIAMLINLLIMGSTLLMGVLLQAPGIAMAAFALTLSTGAELLTLYLTWGRQQQ